VCMRVPLFVLKSVQIITAFAAFSVNISQWNLGLQTF
jgi:hypothetical protein